MANPEPVFAPDTATHLASIAWECPTTQDLRTCIENVILDPETAHRNVIVCPKMKCATGKDNPKEPPQNPKRFENLPCVLGCKGFSSGKHYWEVVVGTQWNWVVGVAKESVSRKSCLNLVPQYGVWAQMKWLVGCGTDPLVEGASFACEHREDEEHLTEHEEELREGEAAEPSAAHGRAQRIGIFLDYEKGQVTFYEQNRVTVMRANFRCEKVFPFFYVHPGVHLKVVP